ncbi:heterokaryon incompatibility protein-domain-containing protein, partial [Hyaloscypha sp. PMI_1271]
YESLRLQPGTYDVMLVVLYPSRDASSDIRCDLVNIDLGGFLSLGIKRFPYIALSYVCGERDSSTTVSLHGIRKEVYPNLLTALRYLRGPNDISLLWIDALCIDQANVEEKNIQIQLMSLLYSKAASVLIFPGDNEAEGKHALE